MIRLKRQYKKYKNRLIYHYYNNKIFQKIISRFMLKGKKAAAYRIVYNTFFFLKNSLKINPYFFFLYILRSYKIPIELSVVRKSGRNYKLAIPVSIERQFKVVLKYLSQLTYRSRTDNSSKKLYEELSFLYGQNKKSLLIKKTDELYKIAVENQTFAHFRWSGRRRRIKKKTTNYLVKTFSFKRPRRIR